MELGLRETRYVDVPLIYKLIEEGHKRSKYKDFNIDVAETKQLLISAIQRMTVKGAGGTCSYVLENKDGIYGFIIGVTERIYHISTDLYATDLFLYISPTFVTVRNLNLLFLAFEGWALENKKVKFIKLGVTDIIDDYNRLGKFYKRKGYRQIGLMFERGTGN